MCVSCVSSDTLKVVELGYFSYFCPALHYPFDVNFFVEYYINIIYRIVSAVQLFIRGYGSNSNNNRSSYILLAE